MKSRFNPFRMQRHKYFRNKNKNVHCSVPERFSFFITIIRFQNWSIILLIKTPFCRREEGGREDEIKEEGGKEAGDKVERRSSNGSEVSRYKILSSSLFLLIISDFIICSSVSTCDEQFLKSVTNYKINPFSQKNGLFSVIFSGVKLS